jgi:hypothetical protein
MLLCLSVSYNAWANTEGGSETKRNGQTDIMAGVVVDYMGKLRFCVYKQNTQVPIEGASIEIYIPSLQRYVFFGVTDDQGIFDLDVAYDKSAETRHTRVSLDGQFIANDEDTVFQGGMLYLPDNNIKYRVYKASWLPYPYMGEVKLETKELPQIVTIYLYQKDGGGGDGGGDEDKVPPTDPVIPPKPVHPGGSDGKTQGVVDTIVSILDGDIPLDQYLGGGAIPKTGVEGALPYWGFGLAAFLAAGVILLHLIKKDRDSVDFERRE